MSKLQIFIQFRKRIMITDTITNPDRYQGHMSSLLFWGDNRISCRGLIQA